MKSFLLLFSMFLLQIAKAQQAVVITSAETTSLIFPAAIRHIDRGSPELLIHQPKDVSNLLLIKAAKFF